MSYLDAAYVNMPSVWKDTFEDKVVVDSLLTVALDSIADSYSEVLRAAISKSIYSDRQLTRTSASSIIVRVSDMAIISDSDGNVVMSIVPVDTTCVRFSYIANSIDIQTSSMVYSSSQCRLVSSPTEISGILARVGNRPSLAGYSKFLVLTGASLIESDLTALPTETEAQARVINLPKFARFDETLVELISGDIESVDITIKDSVTKSLQTLTILRDNINLDSITPIIVLPSYNRFNYSTDTEMTIGENKYNISITTIDTTISTSVLYALNAEEDTLELYSKFSFHCIGTPLATTTHAANVTYATSRLFIEGYTEKNVLRLLNVLNGSPLVTYGMENRETISNYDTNINRIVTNLAVYDLPAGKSISLKAINSCLKINNEDYTSYVLVVDKSLKGTGIGLMARLAESQDVQNVEVLVSSNSYSNFSLTDIGRSYLLLKKKTNVSVATTEILSISVTTGGSTYTIPITGEIRNLDGSSSLLFQKDAFTDYFTLYSSMPVTVASSIGGVYIPQSLYSTNSPRRLISATDYPLVVGSMPIHLIGDYGVYVSEADTLVKSSAYYLYRDFYYRNSGYIHVTYKDSSEGLGIDQVASIVDSLRPVWTKMFYGSSFALSEYVAYVQSIEDSLYSKIRYSMSDTKTINTADIKTVAQSLRVKYLTVKTSGTAWAVVGDLVDLMCSFDTIRCRVTGLTESGYVGLKPTETYIYEDSLHPVRVEGIEILDFDIQGVIGHSNSTAAGDVTAVVGSSLPYTDIMDVYSDATNIPGTITITSRGPSVKVLTND